MADVPLSDRPIQASCRGWVNVLSATAEGHFVGMVTSASWVPTSDPDTRWVNGCVDLAAAGVTFPLGATCVLRFDVDGLGLIQPDQKRATSWTYRDIQAFELGGPGMVQTQSGGGFIGSGFGVAGAAEGMLAAAHPYADVLLA